MEKLPVEIIWQIFEQLKYKDQISLHKVNKRLYNHYKELNLKEGIEIVWRIQKETEKHYPNRNFYTAEFQKQKKKTNKEIESGIILKVEMTKKMLEKLRRNNSYEENEEKIKQEFVYKEIKVLDIQEMKYLTCVKYITNI